MPRLQGKSALITGGTTGIGLATARRFVEEGARVAITGTDPDRLARARETIGAGCIALRGDAGDIDGQRDIARAVGEAFGRLGRSVHQRRDCLDRAERFDQRPYRHAEHDGLRSIEGGAGFARAHPLGRTDRPRHPDERDQSGSRRHAAPRQAGARPG